MTKQNVQSLNAGLENVQHILNSFHSGELICYLPALTSHRFQKPFEVVGKVDNKAILQNEMTYFPVSMPASRRVIPLHILLINIVMSYVSATDSGIFPLRGLIHFSNVVWHNHIQYV